MSTNLQAPRGDGQLGAQRQFSWHREAWWGVGGSLGGGVLYQQGAQELWGLGYGDIDFVPSQLGPVQGDRRREMQTPPLRKEEGWCETSRVH